MSQQPVYEGTTHVRACCEVGGLKTIVNLRRAESKIAPTRTKDGWKEILLGTFRSISEDRVLAVAAGVTFYGLLALFPAIGAIVSLYGLFADGASIRDNLDRISNILPGGAIEIISDQIQRVAAAGSGTLSVSPSPSPAPRSDAKPE